MEETVKILALGGLDEAGKDCYLVDISGELYVIGCGLRYPDKTMPGVDYVIPDCTYLIENKDRVKAYFLLHGHEDEPLRGEGRERERFLRPPSRRAYLHLQGGG